MGGTVRRAEPLLVQRGEQVAGAVVLVDALEPVGPRAKTIVAASLAEVRRETVRIS
jgi:hypothetical protein